MPCSDVLSVVDQTLLQGGSSSNRVKNNSPTISSRKVKSQYSKMKKSVYQPGIVGKATNFS